MTTGSNYNNENDSFRIDTIIEITKIVVSKYASKCIIPSNACEDVEMAIVEKFWKQKDKIIEAFEGKSKISTYFTAIINKMCCEVIRKESKHWYSLVNNDTGNNDETALTSPFETEKQMVFKNEIIRLSKAIMLFNGSGAKVNLFLKYYFDIPITEDDMNKYSETHKDFIKTCLLQERDNSKNLIYEKLAEVVNEVEHKEIKGDAVRMWMNKQIDVLLMRLNHNGLSNHSIDTISILMEMKG